MKNISGFQIGDRVKMRSSSVCNLVSEVEGAEGTVIDIAFPEKYPWMDFSGDSRKCIGQAVVKLDNNSRYGEFELHPEQAGCILAMKFYNAILLHKTTLGIEDII